MIFRIIKALIILHITKTESNNYFIYIIVLYIERKKIKVVFLLLHCLQLDDVMGADFENSLYAFN